MQSKPRKPHPNLLLIGEGIKQNSCSSRVKERASEASKGEFLKPESFSGLTREFFKEIKFTNPKFNLLKNSDNRKIHGTSPRMTQTKAFTIVELIVVITILAIL
jgi:prepilin-type N-terminal cleavage/methylation domain-containing protein